MGLFNVAETPLITLTLTKSQLLTEYYFNISVKLLAKKSHHGDFCCSDTEWVNEGGGTAAGGRVPVAWNVSAGLYGSAGQGVADNPVKPVSHMLSWTIGLCRISKDWESNLNY